MPDIKLGQLKKVPLKGVWQTEAGSFTPWLALPENISILGEAIKLELEVEAKEKEVGPFRADILCKDTASQTRVLIENQLARTDHTHLGQLLTYAAGLHAVTIVWIAERFTDEHRAALDWINEITDDDFNFFGLEIELWQIGNSEIAPKFNVVCQPNDWSKNVSIAAKGIESGSLSDTAQRYLEFWTSFGELMRRRQSFIRPRKPAPQQWLGFSVGRSDFSVVAWLRATSGEMGVSLIFYGPQRLPRFNAVESQKTMLEQAIGAPLDWRELPEKKESQIVLSRDNFDAEKPELWPECQVWLLDKIELFRKTFEPIVKSLE